MKINLSQNSQYRVSTDDLFKFLGCLAMVTCHCFIFLVRALPPDRAVQINFDVNPHFFLPGLMSMAIPALAGYGFFKFLKPYLSGGYLLNLKIKNVIKLFLGLILLDAVKNGILFGFEHAFKWDVLAYVVFMMIVILITLEKFSIKGLWYIVLFNLFVLIAYSWNPIWVNFDLDFIRQAIEYPPVFVFGGVTLLVVGIFASYWKAILMDKKKKSLHWLLGSCWSIFLAHKIYTVQIEEPFFWASLLKLPMSVFIQLGQGGGHIWPLFPWGLVVLSGFLFAYYEKWIFSEWQRVFSIYAIAQIVFNYILFWEFRAFREALSIEDFFSSKFFEPRWQVLTLVLSFYISAMVAYTFILRWISFSSKIVKLYSDGILLFYFIHFFVAILVLDSSIMVFPGRSVFTFYPIVVNVLSFLLLAGIQPIFAKSLQVKFIKR